MYQTLTFNTVWIILIFKFSSYIFFDGQGYTKTLLAKGGILTELLTIEKK